jgi:hypothetical protein
MTRKLLAGWVMLSMGVGVLAVRADDAKPPTPGKPQTPARPETPGRPGRGAANFDALARLTSSVNDLQLTGDKKAKADEILARAKTDLDRSQKEGGDRQAAMGVVRAATEEITALLDEDQKLMFESKLKAAANAPNQPGPGGPGAGQGPGAGGPGGNRPLPIGQRLNEVVSTLGLSDDQKKKVDDLLADLQKKAAEIRGAGNPGPEMREKMQALREDVLKQMKSILTEEQLKKFEQAMQQQPGPGGGGRPGAMLQRLAEGMKDLNLTDDQKPKVQSALADARKKFQELAPQLQGGPTPELRDKLRGVLEGLRDDLSGVLNDEQKEKFRALMQGGPGEGGPGTRRPNPQGEKPADK